MNADEFSKDEFSKLEIERFRRLAERRRIERDEWHNMFRELATQQTFDDPAWLRVMAAAGLGLAVGIIGTILSIWLTFPRG